MVESYIGRIVAGVLTPLLLPVVGAWAVWVNNFAGLDLDGSQLTGFVIAVVAGVAGVAYKWLHNRGEYEKVVKELEALYEAGKQIVPDQPVR